MIDPTAVSTIRVGELSPEPFSLTDNVPHEVGTELKRGTIEDLATFISAFIGSTDGVGFRAISVTDGQTLPTTTQQEFILVGKGTYYNVVGGSTIICTEELNAIVSNGSYWFIGVEIPVNVELAGITQFIRDGFISTTPSEDVIYGALALKANVADSEDVTNKISDITGYSTTLYPNEKATHDALDLKLNISDLPTNLTLYPTTATSDVSGYVVMVKDIHDVRYNSTAVNVSTPTITGVGQLISQRISDAGVLIGQPGVFNITTFGNIRHLSGSGSATFYFEVYHRDLAGIETLICTSSTSEPVVDGGYSEFTASGLWDDGDFVVTDRIVIKSYANRIAGGSDPVYQFQFGGASPVRTLLPVPFSVVDAGYELKSNKQNDLTSDGTGTKYLTVDAANTIDLQKVINVGGYAELGDPNSSIEFASSIDDITDREVNLKIGTEIEVNDLQIDYIRAGLNSANYELGNYASIKAENQNVFLNVRAGAYETVITPLKPLIDTTLNFPSKTVAGTYTLATTDETVNLTGDQTITGSKTFDNTQVILYGGASNPLYIQANIAGAYIENLSTNDGLKIENTSSGDALNINGTTASTGKILKVTNNNVETLNVTKTGNINANSFIKTGGTSTQALMANGSAVQLVTQTITNGVTDKSPSEDAVFDALALKVGGSGTIGNISFWGSGTNISGSSNLFWDNANKRLGIGTSTPTKTFQLVDALGSMSVDGTGILFNRTAVYFENAILGGGDMYFRQEQDNSRSFILKKNGNLLIGTITDNGIAGDKLQVSGAIAVSSTIKAGTTVRLKNYTVATLPAGVQGDTAYVTDALSPTYLGALVGGGSVVCPVFYNGTAWVSH